MGPCQSSRACLLKLAHICKVPEESIRKAKVTIDGKLRDKAYTMLVSSFWACVFMRKLACTDTTPLWKNHQIASLKLCPEGELGLDLRCECSQAVKEDNAGVVASLLGRVSISQAVVQVLLRGPLSQGQGSALHCQAVAALQQLQTLQNFMDD